MARADQQGVSMPPGGAIEQAFIEILGDTTNFDRQVRKDIQKTFSKVRNDIEKAFAPVGGQQHPFSAALKAGQEVSEMLKRQRAAILTTNTPLEKMSRIYLDISDNVKALGRNAPDVLKQAVREMAASWEKLADLLVAGPREALKESEGHFDRFALQVRAALGRAAVAGFDEVEESFEDLYAVGKRELNLLEMQIEDTFKSLGKVEGLDRFRAHFKQLIETIEGDFGRALEDAEVELLDMFSTGELSADEFREAVAKAAVRLDQTLGESVEELNRDLRLMSGDASAFEGVIQSAKEARDAVEATAAQMRADLRAVDDSADRLAETFESVSEELRRSLGRAAVGGFDQLEDSITDLRATGEREFERLEQAIEETLSSVSDSSELERLRGHFDRLTADIRGKFTNALENAADSLADLPNRAGRNFDDLDGDIDKIVDRLKEMEQRGEITFDEFQENVAHVSAELRNRLGGAFDDLNRSLDLVRGDAGAFDSLAEGAEDSARQIEDARRSTGRLITSIEEIGTETREARAQARFLGEEFERTDHKSRGFYRNTMASFNRIRFLFLNMRFIIGGIGIYAAQRFAQFGIDAASGVEQARLSFQTLARNIEGDVGDAFAEFRDEAEVATEQVIEFARETPYSLEQVADGVRKVSAFLPSLGTASDEALSTMKGRTSESIALFEDLTAALAVLGQQDATDGLIKALGDVGAAGRLTGEEMRQLRNALPGIEIRGAIISGILDPTVESTEEIEFLRETFTNLGATATEVPNEAKRAFVDLQRRGLIPANAVVEGLRVSLVNLAGDDALEQFTMTIDGVVEKLREAAEVGSERGFRDLGKSLVDLVIPALEDVEDGAERFASGLTGLADNVIPYMLDGFSGLTELAADVFDAMAESIEKNAGPIEDIADEVREAFELLGEELAGTFFDAAIALADALAPLAPLLVKLVEGGLEILIPVIETATPLIEGLVGILQELPSELLAGVFILGKISTMLVTLVYTPMKRVIDLKIAAWIEGLNKAKIGAFLSNMRMLRIAAVGVTGALAGLLLAGFVRGKIAENMDRGAESVQLMSDALLNLEGRQGASEVIDGLREASEGLTQQYEEDMALYREELDKTNAHFREGSFAHNLAFEIRGLLNPALAEASGRHKPLITEQLRLQDTLSGTEVGMSQFKGRVLQMNDAFDDASLKTALTEEAMDKLAAQLGFTEEDLVTLGEQGAGVLSSKLADAVEEGGGLEEVLRDAGIAAQELDFQEAFEQADTLAEKFKAVTDSITDQMNAIRASNDPVFAALDASRQFEEAERNVATAKDAITEANARLLASEDPEERKAIGEEITQLRKDEETATRAVTDAILNVLGAHSDLAAASADPEVAAGFQRTAEFVELALGTMVEDTDLAGAALEYFQGDLDLAREHVILMGQVMGKTPEEIAVMVAGIETGGADYGAAVEGMVTDTVDGTDTIAERMLRMPDSWAPVKPSINAMADSVTERLARMSGDFEGINDDIVGDMRGTAVGMRDAASNAAEWTENQLMGLDGVGTEVRDLIHRPFKTLDTLLEQEARNAKNAFLDKFRHTGDAAAAGRYVGSKVVLALRQELKMSSPSRVMQDIGQQAIEGLIIGIENMRGKVEGVSTESARALSSSITDNIDLSGADLSLGKLASAGIDIGAIRGIGRANVPRDPINPAQRTDPTAERRLMADAMADAIARSDLANRTLVLNGQTTSEERFNARNDLRRL